MKLHLRVIALLPQSYVNNCFQGMASYVFLTSTFQWQRLYNAKLEAKLVTGAEFGRNILFKT